jgi:hypothetical protein
MANIYSALVMLFAPRNAKALKCIFLAGEGIVHADIDVFSPSMVFWVFREV